MTPDDETGVVEPIVKENVIVGDLSGEDRPLRVLVGLNRLWLAGAELNALDLATKFRERGHHMVVVGQEEDDRAMVELAEHRGFTVRMLSKGRTSLIRPLESIVKEERIQLIHMYGSRLTIAALLGPYRRWGTPVVSTDYGPGTLRTSSCSHLIVGTEECAEGVRPRLDAPVTVIEPPVDVDHDCLDAVDVDAFLADHNIDGVDRPRVVVVSRLDHSVKLEGILRTIDACAALEPLGVTLIIVGSGDAFSDVQRTADQVNDRAGRRAVSLTGRLYDPRAAYAAADVVVGMGGSALRGMAFAKPVVVLGANRFALPFEPATAEYFFWHGFYGHGPMYDLTAALRRILTDPALRISLGQFSRQTVESRYSLDLAQHRLERIYLAALHDRPNSSDRWVNPVRTLAHHWLPDKLRRSKSMKLPVAYS
jgi:Glycosyl transferases group 1/Glycosyltransferase Family 4